MAELNLQPTLKGRQLLLRPLREDDFDGLHAAASDPLIWEQHPDRDRYRRDVFETRFFRGGIASGGALCVIDRPSDTIIGSSRYYEYEPAGSSVCIGYTFLARSHWGGGANREMKSLMLAHAFRAVDTVWFHVGEHNIRSRRAVEKLGATLSHSVPSESGGMRFNSLHYRLDAREYTA